MQSEVGRVFAASTLRPADDEGELFDVVDESNVSVSRALRAVVHRDGLLHRAAHVLLFRRHTCGALQILLQRRSLQKRIGPGLLDLSVAEHLTAGESYVVAAARGIREELGLSIDESRLREVRDPLLRRMRYDAAGVVDNEFVALYAVKYRGEAEDGATSPDEAEVSEVFWMNVGDVLEMKVNGAAAQELTPWFSEELDVTNIAEVAEKTCVDA